MVKSQEFNKENKNVRNFMSLDLNTSYLISSSHATVNYIIMVHKKKLSLQYRNVWLRNWLM